MGKQVFYVALSYTFDNAQQMMYLPPSRAIYRRTGFKCEHVIMVNCDFSPSAQLLERNVYITHSINQYVARA